MKILKVISIPSRKWHFPHTNRFTDFYDEDILDIEYTTSVVIFPLTLASKESK